MLKNSPPTLEKKTRIKTPQVNKSRSSSLIRKYISVKTKRQVWQKSGGKCTNCHSTFALQMDHIKTICQGGDSSEENLRLLCRNCNQREAIKKVGQTTMDRYLT